MTVNPRYASGELWFLPPKGILDGDDFAIAQRYIDGKRADLHYLATDPTMPLDLSERHADARPEWEAHLESQEARLKAGDTAVAGLLAYRLIQEVDQLNHGERTTITGEAHLIIERTALVGSIYFVHRPTDPRSD